MARLTALAIALSLGLATRPELKEAREYVQSHTPQGPGANDDFATIAEGYTSASLGGGLDAAYRMFSLPDFGAECAKARAGDVKSLRASDSSIDARVGVPIPYATVKVDAFDALGVLMPKVPIMIEAYRWSEVLDVRSDRLAEDTVTPKESGTIQLRVRTICQAPGGEAFVTVHVSR